MIFYAAQDSPALVPSVSPGDALADARAVSMLAVLRREKQLERGKMKQPWTHEELADLRSRVERRLEDTETEHANARPLPPLSEDEAHELLDSIIDLAAQRALTLDDCFLFGQTLCCYRMSIEARMLGRKGRYLVLSEEDIARIAK
jgi:hypothetical protein